jgi:prolyl oligopeptidase
MAAKKPAVYQRGVKMLRILATLSLCTILFSCAHSPSATDEYLWLEDVEGSEALKWVETQNTESQKALTESERYKKTEKDVLKILEAKDKIPGGYFMKNYIVNFWRDDKNVRGVLRRTTYENYKRSKINWETILDVDALAKAENKNWVYKGIQCLDPDDTLCLVTLSDGGKDAATIREFNLKTKKFIPSGFTLPEAKSWVAWADKDHLLVGTDFGPGTLTESGYPRQIKLWKRGTDLKTAKLTFEAKPTDVWVRPMRMKHKNVSVLIISRALDFFNSEEHVFNLSGEKLTTIPKPVAAELSGFYENDFIFELRNPWNFAGASYPPGAVIAMNASAAGRELQAKDVQLLLSPKENQSFSGLVELKSKVVFSILEDVQSQLLVSTKDKSGKWLPLSRLELSGKGNISLAAGTDERDIFMYYYESFNQPSTLYGYEFGKGGKKLKALPDYFDAKDIVVEQKFAVSKDGTKVPYFLAYKKGTAFDGSAPTLQYGYGGFTISQTPSYNSIVGKLWLERGGVYAVANIRGGGEYGPKWHQAALKDNRQRAFDDFIAVSEDLIKNKVTSAKHLAIRGGSNGGLLVGAVMTQRPELYGGVLCLVPLLDMLRYSQLLAGASWMSEYGDPKIPRYRKILRSYSPYHNVSANKDYPPTLIITSTKDDRVHPGHARKMTARLKEFKKPVLYYENTEGGHAASSNFKQAAKINALQFEFLYQNIGDPGASKK